MERRAQLFRALTEQLCAPSYDQLFCCCCCLLSLRVPYVAPCLLSCHFTLLCSDSSSASDRSIYSQRPLTHMNWMLSVILLLIVKLRQFAVTHYLCCSGRMWIQPTYNWLHDTMILPRCATYSLLINDEQYEWCMPFRCVPCPYLWPQFSLRLPTRPCQATVMLTQCSRWFCWREWVVSLSIRFLVLPGWSLLQLFHHNIIWLDMAALLQMVMKKRRLYNCNKQHIL